MMERPEYGLFPDNSIVGHTDTYFFSITEEIFGRRVVAVQMKVKAPGRLRFISLNVLLSTFAYSLMLLKS